MRASALTFDADDPLVSATRSQMTHFCSADARCRALQLPEGVLLRYTLSRALYFYLRTGLRDGKIVTAVYASDTPYDCRKSLVGEVCTPMFEGHSDLDHLRKLEGLLRAWVDFVKEEADREEAFSAFAVGEQTN
jgi:hypothetical protein